MQAEKPTRPALPARILSYFAFGAATGLSLMALWYLSDGFSAFGPKAMASNRLEGHSPGIRAFFGGLPNPGLLLAYLLFVLPAFVLRKNGLAGRSMSLISFGSLFLILVLFLIS